MAERRPRLVHVTTTDMSLALLLGPQLTAFRAAGYEVIGVSAPGPYVSQLAGRDIQHIALKNATRSMSLTRDAAAMLELARLFKRLRPDIVHTHNPKPGVYGRLAAAAAGVPLIVNTVHGLYAVPEDRAAKRALVYGLERAAALCSSAELVQNVEDLAVLRRIGVRAEKLVLLGNGIDLARFDPAGRPPGARDRVRTALGLSARDIVVGVVGRLVWEKGLREVFAAAHLLRSQGVRFVIVGPSDPDKADAVDAASVTAAEGDGVLMAGSQEDIEDYYCAFDLFVLASYREGFPRAAMEASVMGLPVVATDIRGCRQVVEDGRTGLLVPVRDAAALAGAVQTLAADPGRRRAMGAAARRKGLAEFDQAQVIERCLTVYRQRPGRSTGRSPR